MSLSLGVFYCCHVCLSVTRSHCMSYLHLIGQFHSILRSVIKRPARGQLLFVRANSYSLNITQPVKLRKGVGVVRASGVLNLVAAYQFTMRE